MTNYHEARRNRAHAQYLLHRQPAGRRAAQAEDPRLQQFALAALPFEGAYLRKEISNDKRWEHLRRVAEHLGVLSMVDWRDYVRTDGVLPEWASEAMRGGNA